MTGDTANDVIGLSGDPNVSIEDKTFSCDVQPGRRSGESTSHPQRADTDMLAASDDHAAEVPDKAGQTQQAAHEPPPEESG